MKKKIFISGLLGGITLIVWLFVVNGILGFYSRINMKRIGEEKVVYELLKTHIKEPGRYICNPAVVEGQGFPFTEPVFGIQYSGLTHGDAGFLMIIGLLLSFFSVTLAAWLLSLASEEVLSSYWKKVLFFLGLGLFLAVFVNGKNYGIAVYPLKETLMLAVHNVMMWTVIGCVVAWIMKPSGD